MLVLFKYTKLLLMKWQTQVNLYTILNLVAKKLLILKYMNNKLVATLVKRVIAMLVVLSFYVKID